MPPTEYSYEQALRSFDSLSSHTTCNGGRVLLRKVLKIGLAEGIGDETMVQDVIGRINVGRDKVEAMLKECHQSLALDRVGISR
jgi:hypothetical protein